MTALLLMAILIALFFGGTWYAIRLGRELDRRIEAHRPEVDTDA